MSFDFANSNSEMEKKQKVTQFWKEKKHALALYGVSDTRAQDTNTLLMRRQRLKNLELRSWEIPQSYIIELDNVIENMNGVEEMEVELSMEKNLVTYVDSASGIREFEKTVRGVKLLSIDFEHHNDNTYDGMYVILFNWMTGASVFYSVT